MTQYALLALDLVAISVLAFGVYFPRHRRRDLVVAYLGVNVGVLAVATALAGSAVGAGLGLGLFGVLSIIRLRSTELTSTRWRTTSRRWRSGCWAGWRRRRRAVNAALMVLVVAVMAVVDHPRMLRRYRQQTMVLDSAITDETALVAHLERLLGATRAHRDRAARRPGERHHVRRRPVRARAVVTGAGRRHDAHRPGRARPSAPSLQTRIDRKYVDPGGALDGLLRGIEPGARVLEIDGERDFAYESVYFDTPDLTSYLGAAHRGVGGSSSAPAPTWTPRCAGSRSRPAARAAAPSRRACRTTPTTATP